MKDLIYTSKLSKIGSLVRSYDWMQTPLGSMNNWSSDLKVAVQILVSELDRLDAASQDVSQNINQKPNQDASLNGSLDLKYDLLPTDFGDTFRLRYDALFDSIDQGFCLCEMIFDVNGKVLDYRFLEINHVFEAMTGLIDAEGKTARELIPNLEDFWFATYSTVVTTGNSIRFEHQSAAMNRWFDVNAFPVDLAQGRGFGLLFTDISDRKRQESNSSFLTEIQKDLVTLEDADLIMNVVGEKIRSFFGFSLLTFNDIDVATDTAINFYNNRDADILDTIGSHPFSSYFSDAHTEKIKTGEIVAIADVTADPDIKDGGAAYLRYQIYSTVNVPYLSKNECKFVLSGNRRESSDWRADELELMRELTARLYLSISRARAEADLRQSEEFKNRMLQGSPDCIKLVGLDGQILYMNEGGISLLEIDDFSKYLHRQWMDFWQDEHRTKAEEALIKARAGEVAQFYGYSPTAKGTPKWWEVIISPLRYADDRIQQLLISSRDISDRHRQELNANFLAEIQKDLVIYENPQEIMHLVGEKIRIHFGFSILTFTEVDESQDEVMTVYNNRESDVLDSVHPHYLPNYLSPTYIADLYCGQSLAVADVTTDPNIVNGGAAYAAFQVRSALCVPHISKGLLKFFLSGCRREPSNWHSDELALMQDLTERIFFRIERAQSAANLKLINQRFETVLQAVNGIIFEWDLQTDRVYRSEGLFQLVGVRAEDADPSREWWMERVHPDDLNHNEAVFKEMQQNNSHKYQTEYRVRHEDGRWIDLWERGNIQRNESGEIIGLVGFTSDVSDRKSTERRLRESERIYRAIGETLEYGIWINDANGQNIYTSPSFLELVGITQAECDGLDWSKYLHPEESDRAVKAWMECVRTETKWDWEHRYLGKDGEWHPILSRGMPVRNDSGEVICWAGINLDISNFKRNEKLLRQSEERLRFTLQSTNTATWDTDLISNKAVWSEQHFTMLGYEFVETGEATYEMWECRIHPDDLKPVRQEWQDSQQERRLYRCEYRICRADNNQVAWVLATGSFTYDVSGRAIRSSGVLLDISDRKFTEEALYFSHQRMDLVINSVELGLWYCNLPFDVLEWNDNCKQHFGLTPETTVTIDLFYKLIHPSDRLRVEREIAASIENHTTYDIDYRTVAPDGQIRWIRAIGRGFYDASGSPTRFDGVTINVTDLKRTESALKQSEERLRLTIEGTQVGTWDQDIQKDRLFWSDRMFQLFGYEPHPTGEASVETWSKCLHPDDAESVVRQWQQSLEGGVRFRKEFRIIRANDRTTRWVEAIGSFKCDFEGRAIRTTGVIFDISDRKFTESALKQSEERYRNLIELIPQLVWTADCEGKAMDVNQRWLDYTGVANIEEAQNIGLTPFIHPDDSQIMNDLWISAQREKVTLQAESRIRRHDGTYRWYLHQAIPIKSDRGEVIKWFGSGTDIEVQKQLEHQYQERNQELDHFTHIVSHDLKAPLRAVSNLSQWLEDDLEDLIPLENKQQLQLMRSRVSRMEGLIDGLLKYARIGREQISTSSVCLSDLLREILDSLAPPPTFKIEITSALPTFSTKHILLSQVLSNLIGNAIKHHGRPDGKISISVGDTDSEFYKFVIADDGKGIDPNQQQRIFDIFQTLNPDNSESTGIGLAIVKKIIESEGGKIYLESELGKGSSFWFTWRKSAL